jgi:uncharacterized membrane protein YkoI
MYSRTIVVTLSALALASGAVASEKKVQMTDLPPAVQKAVQEETKGAVLKGLAKETESGKTYYEAETTVNGHARDLLFDTAGKLVEVEEEMAMDAAPAAVQSALKGKGKGKVLMLESVKKGETVTYEAHIERNGKKSELALDASGKPIKP